ncbi:hypothetical protein VMCG_02368 [Cytospora schulzeri]|uniref:Mutanase n=1 Tax=Cytospora schulzeri TaxID=448051 RepID=A0A423X122_9PEZI|nr:hypothetical protein VMCG_02368 [Valsa malicola]
MGIVANRAGASDYDNDMVQAKELGIDAFALNIGTDSFTNEQLSYAYESAANNDMKVFISFDFNWFSPTSDAGKVGEIIAKYSKEPGQLMIDGKAFASSFSGDGLDVPALKTAAGVDLFFAPNFSPHATPDPDSIDGALNWMGWNTNGDNKAPTNNANVTVVDGDDTYRSWLSQKSYIAPISPWFSTHYGAEVSYSKNFVFPSDLLWYTRWNDILTTSPEFVEIITWNDYGESHYIGPLSSMHDDDGASKWVNDMPHDGWRDVAKPFIAAYKAGAASVDDFIKEDKIVYWYRPAPRTVNCDSTDNTMKPGNNDSGNYFEGKPNGWGDMKDSVFVVTLLTSPGSVTVTSGDNTQTFDAPAGASSHEIPMGVGQQKFSLTRDSETILSGTSLKDIIDSCPCGIYNFNAYVGSLPEGKADPLSAAGLASFTVGLAVETCSATPSLGTAAPVATTPMPTGDFAFDYHTHSIFDHGTNFVFGYHTHSIFDHGTGVTFDYYTHSVFDYRSTNFDGLADWTCSNLDLDSRRPNLQCRDKCSRPVVQLRRTMQLLLFARILSTRPLCLHVVRNADFLSCQGRRGMSLVGRARWIQGLMRIFMCSRLLSSECVYHKMRMIRASSATPLLSFQSGIL